MGNILQPGAISNRTGTNLALISMLQLLKPQVYSQYTEKYGDQTFFGWLATYGGMEVVKNKKYDWFESRSKNQLSVSPAAAVTVPTAGANVVITLSAADHFNSGTESPLREGETVRIASSNVEGRIISVDDSVAGAFTFTVRPLQIGQKFAGITGGITTGDVIKLVGATDQTEGSSGIDAQTHLDVQYSNYVTTIRDTWAATDDAQTSDVFYDKGVSGGGMGGASQAGTSYFTYKALMYTEKRFLNAIEEKLMMGDRVTNTGLGTSNGSQGFLPKILQDGETVDYQGGVIDLAKIHEISRVMAAQGCPKQNMWLMDLYQRQQLNDSLKNEFPAGAFVWGNGEKSEEASLAYGFEKLMMDGFAMQLKSTDSFNTEIKYSKSPTSDYFANYGVICPMGETRDPKSGGKLKNLTVMTQNPIGGGTVGNGIRVWTHGGGSNNPTDGTLVGNIEMVTYRGTRVVAGNQFINVRG
jgi:hypothetical protein